MGDDADSVHTDDPSNADEQSTAASIKHPGVPCAPADALETAAGSVFALEATLSKVGVPPGGHPEAEEAIRSAIELVRTAIDDLQREAGAGARTGLELGFVMRQRRSEQSDNVPAGESL